MKFGKVENPGELDLSLPSDHKETNSLLEKYKLKEKPNIYVGCAKWNKQDLKNFYPRGTKDELAYYSTQFNCIELNATFYRIFPSEQVMKWKNKTPDDFMFFPKIPQVISQFKRLKAVQHEVSEYLNSIKEFEHKLGMIFLQMHPSFTPKNMTVLAKFIEEWPKEFPLAIELRHTDWYNDEKIANDLYQLYEENGITNIITDTAGRRDLIHMRLTSPNAFIRYTGANHQSDYNRLDEWVERIKTWIEQGIQNIYFFVHQNLELESPLLSAYFIEKINEELGYNLKIPKTL